MSLSAEARAWCADAGPLAPVMDSALVIDATSVAHAYVRLHTADQWSVAMCCRHLVPPAPATFVWTRAPEAIVRDRSGATPWDTHSPASMWGVLFAALDLTGVTRAELRAVAAGHQAALDAQMGRAGGHARRALEARSSVGLDSWSPADRLLVETGLCRARVLDGLLAWTAPTLDERRVYQAIGSGVLPRYAVGSWLWMRDGAGETWPLWTGAFWVDAGGGVRDAAGLWLHGEPLGQADDTAPDAAPRLAAQAVGLYLPLLWALEHIATGAVTLSPGAGRLRRTSAVSATEGRE